MARSIAIIGAGQIGYAAAFAFADRGWDADVYARTESKWHDSAFCRFERYVVGETAAPTADVVFDTIAFDAEDIERYDPDKVGQLIVVSSASVYCDSKGRTLDEAAENGFPEFGGPITEHQQTVAPGSSTYSTRKVRMENRAIELFGDRATILRPCAIYGSHSRHPREWWFVKRLLDDRDHIPLAMRGESRFQTTNADLIGNFVIGAVEHGLGGIYNISDTTCPNVLEIGQSIARLMDKEAKFVLIDGYPPDTVGRTPWAVPKPFIVDGSKASADAQLARVTYDIEAHDTVNWLSNLTPTDWRAAFPQLAAYPWNLFDYAAEDAFFEAL